MNNLIDNTPRRVGRTLLFLYIVVCLYHGRASPADSIESRVHLD